MEGFVSREDGSVYEMQFENICMALGYSVSRPLVGNQRAWDRIVNGLKVQVKKRSVDATKPNNIRLVTSLSSSRIVYQTSEVDVFAIFWSCQWYIVPSSAIASKSGVIGNGVYMPSVIAFQQRWDVFSGSTVAHEMQTMLF